MAKLNAKLMRKKEKIVHAIEALRADTDETYAPKIFGLVNEPRIFVSAEDGGMFADYYPDYRNKGYPWIDPRLEKIAEDNGLYWEWQNAGCICLYISL